MKGILIFTFFSLILSPYSFAKNPEPSRETSAVDEKYMDEITTKKSAIERKVEVEATTSGQMYDQEDRQDRGVQKANEKPVKKTQ